MKIFRFLSLSLMATFSVLFLSAPAQAQATRTWVSGVGDDVNPCSRTAPCKTFAGAISKTAAGGEINCLDPAGFGAVTITKSMTIDCHYTEGGALAGGNGIVVNLPTASDIVVLRGLDIFGVNPPSNGIRFIGQGKLFVEDTRIQNFDASGSYGISAQPSGPAQLFVHDVLIANNGNGATGGGILIQPTGANGNARVSLSNVRVLNNANVGMRVDSTGNTNLGGISVVVRDSDFDGNNNGMQFIRSSGANLIGGMIVDSSVSNNTVFGITTDGGAVTVRLGNTTVTGNAAGLSAANGSVLATYGDNRVIGNPIPGPANDGNFTTAPIGKQ